MAEFWVKIPAGMVDELPIDRPYTVIEAAFSLELDRVMGTVNSIRGYSRMWSWPKSNVARFLSKYDVLSVGATTSKTNQNCGTKAGQKRDKSGTHKRSNIDNLHGNPGQKRDKGGTEADRNYKRKIDRVLVPSELCTADSSRDLFEAWNEIVKDTPLPVARSLSSSRAKKCLSRLAERSLDDWREIFRRMTHSPFLCGQKTGWRADFDWIIQNDGNAVKVLEGKYDGADSRGAADDGRYSMFAGV